MHVFRPDSYKRIVEYAHEYRRQIEVKTSKGGLTGPTSDDDVFAVLMDKGDVARLLLHPDCHKLAAIIGIADDGQGPTTTISLLAVDREGHVLPQHQKPFKELDDDPQLPGEEVWPVKIRIGEMDEFLPI